MSCAALGGLGGPGEPAQAQNGSRGFRSCPLVNIFEQEMMKRGLVCASLDKNPVALTCYDLLDHLGREDHSHLAEAH